MSPAAAASRYKQVRLTYTEEAGGRISYRIAVKPLAGDWTMKHTVVADVLHGEAPATSIEDVFRRLELILREQHLPESHG